MNLDKYEEAVKFLRGVIKLFEGLKVGIKGEWKPIQTGVLLSTTSVLNIADELLDAGHKFLLTSRLTQDCLENLFLVVRLKKPMPSPLEFKYALKMISSAQYLTLPRSGSYHKDDGKFLTDFFNHPVRVPCEPQVGLISFSDEQIIQDLPQAERDSLYNLAGYCMHSIRNNEKTCDRCMKDVINGPHDTAHQAAGLTQLKEFPLGYLVNVCAMYNVCRIYVSKCTT